MTKNGAEKPLSLRGWLTPVLLKPGETKTFEESIATGMVNRCHTAVHGDDDAELEVEIVYITMRNERRFVGPVSAQDNPRCRFSAGASPMLLGGPFRSVRVTVKNMRDEHAACAIDFEASSR
jgi:hypothetical protein